VICGASFIIIPDSEESRTYPAGGHAMDSYVIRIYRRDADNPRNCAGLAEVIETDEKKTFKNLDELLEILKTQARNSSEKKRGKTI
jgi:hypothetical protein